MESSIWNAYPPIDEGIIKVKQILTKELSVKNPTITQKIQEYIDAPGKYLRAGLCLMMNQLNEEEISDEIYLRSAAIEAFHLATLIHDDVIDHSSTRRGIVTMHEEYSNKTAIYAGDYLLAVAGRLLKQSLPDTDHQSYPFLERLIEHILVGELNQLTNKYQLDMSIYDYLRQIRGKTALLFAAATFAGYYRSDHSYRQNKHAFYVGQNIGMAFQLMDDVIDLNSSLALSGKPSLQDVQNGIYTAPVLYAINENDDIAHMLKEHLSQPWQEEELNLLLSMIEQTSGLQATAELTQRYTKKAHYYLSKLSQSPQAQVIHQLCDELILRVR